MVSYTRWCRTRDGVVHEFNNRSALDREQIPVSHAFPLEIVPGPLGDAVAESARKKSDGSKGPEITLPRKPSNGHERRTGIARADHIS
jgi:hypothetical protein